jgi:hypothetical protein
VQPAHGVVVGDGATGGYDGVGRGLLDLREHLQLGAAPA